jgi:hypothetical protein
MLSESKAYAPEQAVVQGQAHGYLTKNLLQRGPRRLRVGAIPISDRLLAAGSALVVANGLRG